MRWWLCSTSSISSWKISWLVSFSQSQSFSKPEPTFPSCGMRTVRLRPTTMTFLPSIRSKCTHWLICRKFEMVPRGGKFWHLVPRFSEPVHVNAAGESENVVLIEKNHYIDKLCSAQSEAEADLSRSYRSLPSTPSHHPSTNPHCLVHCFSAPCGQIWACEDILFILFSLMDLNLNYTTMHKTHLDNNVYLSLLFSDMINFFHCWSSSSTSIC